MPTRLHQRPEADGNRPFLAIFRMGQNEIGVFLQGGLMAGLIAVQAEGQRAVMDIDAFANQRFFREKTAAEQQGSTGSSKVAE